MINAACFTEAHTRLQELDHLIEHKPFMDEWWATMAAEVAVEVSALKEAVAIASKGRALDEFGATRGVLIGLLAARYSAATEPGEVL